MNKLIVKQFGPLDSISINIKKINILIGTTSSGKSTIAKLIAIFKESRWEYIKNLEEFEKFLVHYNIKFEIHEETYIKYIYKSTHWELKNKKVTIENIYQNIQELIPLQSYESTRLLTENSKENAPKEFKFLSHLITITQLSIFSNEEKINSVINYYKKINETQIVDLLEELKQIDIEIYKGNLNKMMEANKDFIKLFNLISDKIENSNSVYIPAERIFISMIADSILSLINNDVTLAKCIKDFGSNFEKARKSQKEYNIKLGENDLRYSYTENKNTIEIKGECKFNLENASSGLQSIIPLLLVLNNSVKSSKSMNYIVIEEPELSLFPSVQKDLVEIIIGLFHDTPHTLMITTHSPYILTCIDNLIVASNVVKQKPDQLKKVTKFVDKTHFLDFNETTVYYINKGKAKEIMNSEFKRINTGAIDNVSEKIESTYNNLLNIQYGS